MNQQEINKLQGPILVLGAGGFIGASLLRSLLSVRKDVFGTVRGVSDWRLRDVPSAHLIAVDIIPKLNIEQVIETTNAVTIFNCLAYGGFSFEVDSERIYETNFMVTTRILKFLCTRKIAAYIHAGSSSEYGDNAAAPLEGDILVPNSDYSVSKIASSYAINYYGKYFSLPCVNLRLYSVYGPLEDASRLIPTLVRCGLKKEYPPFVNPEISRDLIYIDDVVEAFITCAVNLNPDIYGESFNIGTGIKTTIADLAVLSKSIFNISNSPQFQTMQNKKWDKSDWYCNAAKSSNLLNWNAKYSLEDGLKKTTDWMTNLGSIESYVFSSKQFSLDRERSITAIIACYKDEQAIPIMYTRLQKVFEKLKTDYEIIFVNDNSPDNSEEIIKNLSQQDCRVLGISHSRNFGSQAAFISGMQIASKKSCVLLDGDLQDPPELIEEFVAKWKEGFDVVYGRRVKRKASLIMQISYKLFYRIFSALSYIKIPVDAGDFSLIDQKVVKHIVSFPERDLFLRGIRAFVGFKQVGIDYYRPDRVFGRSTNNFFKNVGWAKKGILSFTNTPLNVLSFCGVMLFLLSILLLGLQLVTHFIFPSLAPKGITTILLTVGFFGSLNLLSLAILGEYIAKIFEETKRRPLFIRKALIKNGDVRSFPD